jgi:hypothetical protein
MYTGSTSSSSRFGFCDFVTQLSAAEATWRISIAGRPPECVLCSHIFFYSKRGQLDFVHLFRVICNNISMYCARVFYMKIQNE